MCGRYASYNSPAELQAIYGAKGKPADLGGQYNVAPTDSIYAVFDRTNKDDPDRVERQLQVVRWGLVPSWAKDTKGAPLINARVETIAEKPSWRKPFRQRRCIIPAAGYYEWTTEPNEVTGKTYKQPWYLHPAAGSVLNFAGLYEWWRDPTKADDDPDRWLWSAAIITCEATGPAGEVHDRTPVVVPNDRIDAWLDPAQNNPEVLIDLIGSLTPPLMGLRAISTAVNKVGTNSLDLSTALSAAIEEPTIQLAVA